MCTKCSNPSRLSAHLAWMETKSSRYLHFFCQLHFKCTPFIYLDSFPFVFITFHSYSSRLTWFIYFIYFIYLFDNLHLIVIVRIHLTRDDLLPVNVLQVFVEFFEMHSLIKIRKISRAKLDLLADKIFEFKRKCVDAFVPAEYSYSWPNFDARIYCLPWYSLQCAFWFLSRCVAESIGIPWSVWWIRWRTVWIWTQIFETRPQ
jgi:hypothetical protein